MIKTFEDIINYSHQYNVPLADTLAIAINRYGVKMNSEDNRIRFTLNSSYFPNPIFFAVCVNTCDDCPFNLIDNELYISGTKIGDLINMERDTCTSTYFRNNKKSITFNSNSRSTCVGCAFCGTYQLDGDDFYDFSTEKNILRFFKLLLCENGLKDLSEVEAITLCTGCFDNEDELIKHIKLLNKSLRLLNFNGSFNYIGSQLRDNEKIKDLVSEVGKIGMYFTLEKFTDRDKIMKEEKYSLSIDRMKEIGNMTCEMQMPTTFLYILGLEDLKIVKEYMNKVKTSINKFPNIQIFQNYNVNQEQYRCEAAKDFGYYLEARNMISDIFSEEIFVPKSWENYRSLYYTEYNGVKLRSLR